MKVIVFNTENTTINLDAETQMIKYGYLIADKLCIAGQLAYNIMFEEEHKKFSIIKKVQILYDIVLCDDSELEDKEVQLKTLQKLIVITKEFSKRKNTSKELLIKYNTLRRKTSDWFDTYRINNIKNQLGIGLLVLSALSKDKKIETSLLNISVGSYTHSKHESESNAKLILELLFPTNQASEETILMLPYEFSLPTDSDTVEEKGEPTEGNEAILEFSNLIGVLEIPEVKYLTALQLKALNGELSEDFGILSVKFEDWIRRCKKETDLQNILTDFESNVGQHFETMQNVINHNQTLTDIKNNPRINSFKNQIYIGILDFEMLWDFYERYKVVNKETLGYLKMRTINNTMYPKYFPVLHILPEIVFPDIVDNLHQELNEDGTEKPPIKKYLNID